MVERKRTRLSPTEKNEIWERWKAGQSMHEIGRAYGRPHPTIRKLLFAAVCISAGVVLLGAPKDVPAIGKDVGVAVFPWLLACGLLANGALDHSSEVI